MKQTLMSTAATLPPPVDLEEPAGNGVIPAQPNGADEPAAIDRPTVGTGETSAEVASINETTGPPAGPTTVETMTVHPEVAFKKLGVGRSAGYDALHRGEIPSIRIGRFFRVPSALLDKMLAGEWKPGQ